MSRSRLSASLRRPIPTATEVLASEIWSLSCLAVSCIALAKTHGRIAEREKLFGVYAQARRCPGLAISTENVHRPMTKFPERAPPVAVAVVFVKRLSNKVSFCLLDQVVYQLIKCDWVFKQSGTKFPCCLHSLISTGRVVLGIGSATRPRAYHLVVHRPLAKLVVSSICANRASAIHQIQFQPDAQRFRRHLQ